MESALIYDSFLCLLNAEQLLLFLLPQSQFSHKQWAFLPLAYRVDMERVITHSLLLPRALSYFEIEELWWFKYVTYSLTNRICSKDLWLALLKQNLNVWTFYKFNLRILYPH